MASAALVVEVELVWLLAFNLSMRAVAQRAALGQSAATNPNRPWRRKNLNGLIRLVDKYAGHKRQLLVALNSFADFS